MTFRFALKSGECPDCGSHLVRHSRRRTFVERIAFLLLLVRPYRCDDCDIRFFTFETRSARKFAH